MKIYAVFFISLILSEEAFGEAVKIDFQSGFECSEVRVSSGGKQILYSNCVTTNESLGLALSFLYSGLTDGEELDVQVAGYPKIIVAISENESFIGISLTGREIEVTKRDSNFLYD